MPIGYRSIPWQQEMIRAYWITAEEASKILGCTTRHVSKLCQRGAIPHAVQITHGPKGTWLMHREAVAYYQRGSNLPTDKENTL